MPRVTTERLLGYSFGIVKEEAPVLDDGHVIHNGKGEPKTEEKTTLVLVDPSTGHTLEVPFSEEARQELVRQLTGGIVVPNGSS